MSATITWVDAAEELPDADQTVLVHLEDGEVWTGFLDGTTWRFVSAEEIETPVMHWAAFPEPPAL
jgi:hypothetical protein